MSKYNPDLFPVILSIAIIILVSVNYYQARSLTEKVTKQDHKIDYALNLVENVEEKYSSVNPNGKDVSNVDINELKSTGASIAALFPVENVRTAEDAMNVILPSGTPFYGSELGVTFDDPINSLEVLQRMERQDLIKLNQEEFQRYLNIVTKPVGISCEYCCSLKYIGVNNQGKSICGCKHNPALLAVTKWLVKNSELSDPEIVREALRWKAVFFPKDMTKLTLQVGGGDESTLKQLELAGMVGGC